MFIVMGGTGHVGGAVARALAAQGQPVTIVTRHPDRAEAPAGVRVAGADLSDPDSLREIFRTGRRAFLLNPPGPIDGNVDDEERRTAGALIAALDGSELEKLVVQSTYGAQAGEAIGDLGTLYCLEQRLAEQPIAVTIQRGAYFMTNWDAQLSSARDEGRIMSMFPADLPLPMVAPDDLGRAAARWLQEPLESTGLRFVEGPARYTANDVAAAFSRVLGRLVAVEVIPPEAWEKSYRKLGFSDQAARSFAGMIAASMRSVADFPIDPVRGSVTLDDHIRAIAAG